MVRIVMSGHECPLSSKFACYPMTAKGHQRLFRLAEGSSGRGLLPLTRASSP
jgi:hypothetical protein